VTATTTTHTDAHPAGERGRKMPALYLVVGALSWPVIRFVFRTRWRDRRAVPAQGGAVVASNHISNFDPWPLALGLFPGRTLRFMAKVELFRGPLAPILRALGGFPVDRSVPDRQALAVAVQLCRDGELVVMFPEGTRRSKGMRKKHEAQPHTGAARIALRAGVPLVPVAVWGTDRLSRLGPLRVAYGDPVVVADLASLDRRSAAEEATRRLMDAIARLEAELAASAR
jgi:1-acyl-sn-glycerol-3-phosphate acyltransferase